MNLINSLSRIGNSVMAYAASAGTFTAFPLHAPERQQGESFEDYRQRRVRSQAAVKRMSLKGPHFAPGHKEPNGRQIRRNHMRENGMFKNRLGFGATLQAAWANLRLEQMTKR